MLRNKLRKKKEIPASLLKDEARRKRVAAPAMRSPALDAAERTLRQQRDVGTRPALPVKRARRQVSYAVEGTSGVQVMSEEEQKKLQALEMRLPRVAGKVDSVLLVIVLALLCIGLVMVYSSSSF